MIHINNSYLGIHESGVPNIFLSLKALVSNPGCFQPDKMQREMPCAASMDAKLF